ncbi:4-hydroxy-tetrahydrodipicolinate synthase [Aliikangiella sp. IMCC44653]
MDTLSIRNKKLFTAIKTPFMPSGKIDLKRFDKLVEQQIDAGVDGLIVGGTTGEGHLLDWEEHLMLISHSVNHYAKHLVIVGNTGSNNTRESIRATEYGFASGMHASLQVNPYYGKTNQEGMLKHLSLGLNLGPAFVYNVPARTCQDIPVEVVKELAQHTNFIGMKECAGNIRIKSYEEQGIPCWSGNDDEAFLGVHQCHSHGVISVASNLVPKLMRQLMDDVSKSSLNNKLAPLFKWLFDSPNPIPLNTALALTQAVQPVFRLPYLPVSAEQRQLLIDILKQFNAQDIVGSQVTNLADEAFISVI